MTIKGDTQDWIRNAADDLAARSGMVFDTERAEFACHWIESNCCLYEGDQAGELLTLMPYQRDYVSRLFGWVRPSREYHAWIRRFTHAALWAAKKNGKSPLCAAVNLYLLIADGEKGQKVYQGAKNGEQAQLAQAHAVMMVQQSPALSADCKIHGSTMAIRYLPTNSELRILCGDDTRGAKSKEGINGSVAFDECHVVDREMYRRTKLAGISRREPLILSYSTAGDDLSSVGYERYQYGQQVNKGERLDPHFLHIEYSAPECPESEIEGRLEELGQAANPAWGILVKPSEFVANWRSSKISNREIADFLQYRLNRWVGSSTRWLDQSGWNKGSRSYGLPDLAGREAYAAIDLSRTRDMSSVVFSFPWPEDGPEALRLWPMFWLPEERAKELHQRYPYLDWAAKGWIKLTKGSTVDYNQIKDDVREVVNKYRLIVMALFYDEHYANELTQGLHEGETIDGHSVPSVVGERIVFPQSMMTFSPPAKEFERRVIAGLLQHPGNGVLNWQAEHCEVKSDKNLNIRPIKPGKDTGKSIDGIIAGVMNMAGFGAMKGDWPESFFKSIYFEGYPSPEKNFATVVCLDPNKAKDDNPNDYQAHISTTMDNKGHFWVECECRRDSLQEMVKRSLEISKERKAASLVLPAIPELVFLQPEFLKAPERKILNIPIETSQLRDTTLNRIRRLENYLSVGQIHIRNTIGGRLLVEALKAFPNGHYTAAPRALEMSIRRLELAV